MHPIERLRWVARSTGEEPDGLAREVAVALADFADDPASLLTACRRLMERHPTSGPVWWVCGRTLSSPDPEDEVWRCLERLDRDPTMDDLSFALADGATVVVVGWSERLGPALARRGDLSVRVLDVEGDGAGFARLLDRSGVTAVDVDVAALSGAVTSADLVLLDAAVVGPDALLAAPGSHAAAALAHTAGLPVWAAVGEGRLLGARLWDRARSLIDQRAGGRLDLGMDVVPLALLDRLAVPTGIAEVADALASVEVVDATELG